MGWLYSQQSRKDMVRGLVEQPHLRTLARRTVGNVMYCVFEYATAVPEIPGGRFIAVFLLGRYREHGEVWNGYKDMEESMGPTESTCPPEFFDLVPEPPNEWARAWRERCRQHAEKLGKKLTVGAKVRLVSGCAAAGVSLTVGTVVSTKPLTAMFEGISDPVRLTRRHLAEILG